jgi:hypothetical protein
MKTLTLIVLMFLTFEYSFAQADTAQAEHPPNGHNSPYRIEFTDLISHTQYYDGQQLEVIGYLSLKFESDALWLSEADYSLHDYKKAIYVNLSGIKHAKRFNHHYVIIEAVFHRWDRGLGLTGFELNIKSLRRWRIKGSNK